MDKRKLKVKEGGGMSVLKNIGAKQENTEVRLIRENLIHAVGSVPKPLEMMAVSPGLFQHYYRGISYYKNHPKLEFETLLFLRYLVARKMHFAACVEFNGEILKKQGVTEDELEMMVHDCRKIPLVEASRRLIYFVLTSLDNQEESTEKAFVDLLNLGWSENDIFDAVNHGFSMIAPGLMLKLFKV